MKKLLQSYQGRCWLLGIGAVLLLTVLWKKRLSTTVERWRAATAMVEGLNGQTEAGARVIALRSELTALNSSLGDIDLPADGIWRNVLERIGQRGATNGVELHKVDAELVSTADGNVLHVLPVTIAGRYAELLRTTTEIERAVPEAHPISMHFHTERASYGKPRKLLLTLYLQKIVRHG